MAKMKKETQGDRTATPELDRRGFLGSIGLGAAGLAVASTGAGILTPEEAIALSQAPNRQQLTPGLTPPWADEISSMPSYSGPWNQVVERPFGGFDFAMGYVAEGIDGMDPLQNFRNPSGLFESQNPAIPSGVGGNEFHDRSAEYWYLGIMGWSKETFANDLWSAINWARRMWGVDLDDPAADGMVLGDGSVFSYAGSPNADDVISLFSPRLGIDGRGGYVRMAPTLLAPSVGYTVVFRAGTKNPNYQNGTTARSPEDPGKVRDGGVWGGVVSSMDVLETIQDAAAGRREYTTPFGTRSAPAAWGQYWRRVAPLVGVDVDDINPNTPVEMRPTPRPNWPVGYLPAGTDFFWGNYNLKFGRLEEPIVLHYESQLPTRFRDSDGVPETFLCELTAHPGGTDMPQSQIDQGFKDVDGSLSGFPDLNDPSLDGQNQFGLGRVHGTSYPRGVTADGRATFHLRNWLLFPPRLNAVNSVNDTVPGVGVLDFG